MELMRSQKNQLLELIKALELEPFNFEWDTSKNRFGEKNGASILKYKETPYFFKFDIGDFIASTYSPAVYRIIGEGVNLSWSDTVNLFQTWLYALKRELEEPDLWAELEKVKLFDDMEYASKSTTQQFTYQETLQIEKGINEIRSYLTEEVGNNAEQLKLVNDKLDYLIDASKRMGRVDWKNIFVGALVNIATSIGLNPEQAQHVTVLFQQAASGLMKLLP